MFLVGTNGKATSLLDKGGQYNPGSASKWLKEELTAYERAHPRTRVPLTRSEIEMTGEGDGATYTCKAFDQARKDDAPTVVYFGRDSFQKGDKAGKKQNKRCRSFEKSALGSKKAAKEAEGWTLLRVDLADPVHTGWAKAHGVTEAPAMLLWPKGATEAIPVKRNTTGGSLAFLLKKHKLAPEPVEAK